MSETDITKRLQSVTNTSLSRQHRDATVDEAIAEIKRLRHRAEQLEHMMPHTLLPDTEVSDESTQVEEPQGRRGVQDQQD